MSALWSRFRVPALVAVVLGGSLLAACGGGEEESGGTSAKATTAAGAGAEGGELAVELSEWAVKPAKATAANGAIEFNTTNKGATPHELLILKTDTAPDKLEKASGVVDESKYQVIGRTKNLNGGQAEELKVSLPAGKYVLVCNISGHYDLGMRTAFTAN